MYLTRQLTDKVRQLFGFDESVQVDYAMSYSQPSIEHSLRAFKACGVQHIVVLPLYPQYSSTTTASVHDSVVNEFKRWKHIPQFTFISDYCIDEGYINALAESIQAARKEQIGELLVMSFHGLPKQLVQWGDPYCCQCHKTATALAEKLGLDASQWMLVFQSRFGKAEWLKPYCVDTLMALPTQGIKHIDVVCPGFAVDCLETLEEIAMENKAVFLAAGGETYRYIPALNDSVIHAASLVNLIKRVL